MPAETSTDRRSKIVFRLWGIDLFVLSQLLVAHTFMAANDAPVGLSLLRDSALRLSPGFVVSLIAGALVRFLWEAFHKRGRAYLHAIATAQWLIGSLRLVIVLTVMCHVYFWLKLTIPLTHPVNFDLELWNFERVLFLGHSPNVFFLELFATPWLLRSIDFIYGILFIATVKLAIPFAFGSPNHDTRFKFMGGNAILWIVGAWLYVLIPSVGPIYRFPQVWDAWVTLLPRSQFWQRELLLNYRLILDLASGMLSSKIQLMYGVAAFPSLHVGFQAFVYLWVRRYSKLGAMVMVATLVLTFIGSIVTGWHYLIDAAAGLVLALGAYQFMERLVPRPRQDPEAEV